MSLAAPHSERYLGGFYVEGDEDHDAVYRGRCARYVIVLDSYADAVAWRRAVAEGDTFIIPLSQAAGSAATRIRTVAALEDAKTAYEAEKSAKASTPKPEPEPEPEPMLEGPTDLALGHLRALLDRDPSVTDYDEMFVPVQKCAYCKAPLTGEDFDGHTDDCAWQAARRFLLDTIVGIYGEAAALEFASRNAA